MLKSFLKVCPTFSLPDKNRRNLIRYAAANYNPDVIKFLLANGCDANELDAQRRTPLMIASELGRLQTVQALLEHFEKRGKKAEDEEYGEEDDDGKVGFNVDFINFKDRSSWTALQFAASSGHLKVVAALIEAGAEVDTKNSKQFVSIM